MPEDNNYKALTFATDDPEIPILIDCYNAARLGISDYLDQTEASYNLRHEIWSGKAEDQRKHGAAAFPWNGASDLETRITEDKIRTYVAIFLDAMGRSHIQAYPVEVGDVARAKIVSSFLKWMTTGWIEGFDRYLDQSANHFGEKGLMISFVGWEQKRTSYLESLNMDEIAAKSSELAELLANPENDEAVVGMIESYFEGVNEKRARKALKQLRRDGRADLPLSKVTVDRPLVRACRPDSDVLFPSWCIDPKRAPYAFYRDFMTPQEILGRVESDGWDGEWAEYVIENHLGVNDIDIDEMRGDTSRGGRKQAETAELVEVVWMYQRLIDEIDSAEGIYLTIFHPRFSGDSGTPQPYAKHELLSGVEQFPFVVTELCSDEALLYETTTFPDMIRGTVMAVKKERDARIDGNSKRNLPERFHPTGRPPARQGPGVNIGYRRRDEVYYGDVPPINPDAVAIDDHLMRQSDILLGLSPDDPNAATKKNYYIRKFLTHVRDVLKACYELYNLHGPEELFFRVTGLPEQMRMEKSDREKLDITVSFDTLHSDPDGVESMLRQLFQIIPMDQGGRINMDAVITFAAAAISPTLASQILQPSQEGAQDLLRQFTEDWAKIWSGIEIDAPPNGAGIILPALEGLQSQQDVVERMQTDEALQKRVQNYVQQLQFQMQQTQNAEIGRRGAKPADITLTPAPYPEQNGAARQ